MLAHGGFVALVVTRLGEGLGAGHEASVLSLITRAMQRRKSRGCPRFAVVEWLQVPCDAPVGGLHGFGLLVVR